METPFVFLVLGVMLMGALYLLPRFSPVGELCCQRRWSNPPVSARGQQLVRCPELRLSGEETSVEGYRVSGPEALIERLQELAKVDEMTHEGRARGRCINVLAERATPAGHVLSALRAAARAGYDQPALVVELKLGW